MDIYESNPTQPSEAGRSGSRQVAAAGDGGDVTISECSLYCHAAVDDDGRATNASATANSDSMPTTSKKIVYTRDMEMTPSPIPTRTWGIEKGLLSFPCSSTATSEDNNEASPSYDMTRGVADLREQDRILCMDQDKGDDSPPRGRLFSRSTRVKPRGLISPPKYSFSDLSAEDDDSGFEEGAKGTENQRIVCEVPFRQHEPSAETVNISLPPETSPGWSSDDPNNSPERLITFSPAPLSALSLDNFKRHEDRDNKSSPGKTRVVAPASPEKNATQQLEGAEECSPKTLRTPNRTENCRGVLSPTTRASQNGGLQNFLLNTPRNQKSSPSKSSSVLTVTPQTRVKGALTKSPQEGSCVSTGSPEEPDLSKNDASPSAEDVLEEEALEEEALEEEVLEEEPIENFLIQQFENSPTSSQGKRTAFVRSWFHPGESNDTGNTNPFSPDLLFSPSSTHRSSVANDDGRVFGLDGCSTDDGAQNASSDHDNGDLISLAASPTPSSKLEMPWNSVSLPEESKADVSSRGHNDGPGDRNSCTGKVMPYAEEVNGSMAIVFPGDVIEGTFKVHVVATSDFNGVDNDGWREFILPEFNARDGDRGTLIFNFMQDRKAFEFDTEALPWAEIDVGFLHADFELSKGLALPVHTLHTQTHKLVDGFTIDSNIQSIYCLPGSGSDHPTLEYTATCVFKVKRQNFFSERCCFHILLERGPWGRFESSLDEQEWHVRLDPEDRSSVADTEIRITCPFADIGKPFRISWGVDLKGLPAKTWIPKIRPLFPEERIPRPVWSQNWGMPYEAVSTAVVDEITNNEFDMEETSDDVKDALDGVEETPAGADERPNDSETHDDQNDATDASLFNQDAPEDKLSDNQGSATVERGGNQLEGVGKYGRRVLSGYSESDTSSEFMDHPGSPWIERDFGMVTFLVPLLFIIGGLLRKIIGHKIRRAGGLLVSSVRGVGIRAWLRIGLLVYLGSLFMGATPIQRFDEIVHRLAVVERQATVGAMSPSLGQGDGTVIKEQGGLFMIRSTLEDLCKAVGRPEAEVANQEAEPGLSVSAPADKPAGEVAGGKADKPKKVKGRDKDQNRKLGGFSEGERERKFSPTTLPGDADTVSVPTTKMVQALPEEDPHVTIPSMRDKIDLFLGWRDPEDL